VTAGTRAGPQFCPRDPLRILVLPLGPSRDPRSCSWDPGGVTAGTHTGPQSCHQDPHGTPGPARWNLGVTAGTRMRPQFCPRDPLRILVPPPGPLGDPWDPGPARRDPQSIPILPQRILRELGPVSRTLTRPWSWSWSLLRTPVLP